MRQLSMLDQFLNKFAENISSHTLADINLKGKRPNPALHAPEAILNAAETQHVIGLMRVNHAGEIAAQGLYQGQALTARLTHTRQQMLQAADEEIDHLVWCRERLTELGGHVSYFDPAWYVGSFLIGALAGAVGDKWSLGFIAETEQQVSDHLAGHLQHLPPQDRKSALILQQMKEDEEHHGAMAKAAGAVGFPGWVKGLMKMTSKVMVTIAYRW